jgi:hypothetical protein
MKLLKNLLVSTLFVSFFLIASNHTIQANTLTTSQDTKGGQVITTNEDGVFYLSTKIATPAAGTTSTATRNGQTSPDSIDFDFQIPEGFATSFDQFLNAILSAVLLICALLVLFYLITGALQWITSGGDKGKIEQARNKMFAAIVGIIIVAASYSILLLILNFLGFESLEDLFRHSKTLNERTGIQFVNIESSQPVSTDSAQTDLGEITN